VRFLPNGAGTPNAKPSQGAVHCLGTSVTLTNEVEIDTIWLRRAYCQRPATVEFDVTVLLGQVFGTCCSAGHALV